MSANDLPARGTATAPSVDLHRIKCVALGYGGTLDDRTKPKIDGSYPVADACVPVLHTLVSAGITLVLSSNTIPGEHRWPALNAAGVAHLFAARLCSASIGRRKPEPSWYWAITAFAACPPLLALHVGNDLMHDVIAPSALGMRTALLRPNGPTDEERAQLPANAVVISGVPDLPALLGITAPPPTPTRQPDVRDTSTARYFAGRRKAGTAVRASGG